jgi:cell division septation protein DedD
MTQATIRAAMMAAAAAVALAGCAEGTGSASIGASDAADAPVARAAIPGRLVERDVEAPEVFQVTDQALWDGRPSLGGVWVASPDAVDPERVIIRNPDNGNFVIGALFRRERLNPGPTLQISSDAAAALGILAGAPTSIEVVALRRTEEADPAPAEEATPDETAVAAAGEEGEEPAAPEGDDIGAAAVAALDAGAAPDSQPAVAAEAAADPAAEATEVAVVPAVATEPEKPKRKKRKWFWQKAPADEPLSALPAAEGTAETAAVAGIDTAAIAATALPAPGAPPADAAAAPEAAPAVASAAPAPQGGQVIQIGFFSVEENAQRAVDKLAASGIPARVLTEHAKGKTFWRVVAGPGGDAGLLGKVKSAGFGDAYFVRG